MLTPPEILARLRLARTDGVGPVTFRRFLDRYGTAQRALDALPELAARRGAGAKPMVACPQSVAEEELSRIDAADAKLLVFGDDDYPALLAATDDAPMTLTVLGNANLLKKSSVAIVGSRNASLQGRRFAESVSENLGRTGLCITSGLARGIDTAAHGASLNTGTIAVVAGGVDVIYPLENKQLYAAIAEKGCIVAENPLGMQPSAQHFPRRNRIISGLSLGVVVVEATTKSGSLITAHIAADQGREVFAVPGHPFDPRASGPNSLIRDGATLVTSAADILDALSRQKSLRIVREPSAAPDYASGNEPDPQTLNEAHSIITDLLGNMPVSVDELIAETGIPASVVQTVLLELELAGSIQRHPQNRVSAPSLDVGIDRTAATM